MWGWKTAVRSGANIDGSRRFCPWSGAARGAYPGPPRLGCPRPFKHGTGVSLAKKCLKGEHVPARIANPASGCRTARIDAATAEDLRLSLGRKVIESFAHQYFNEPQVCRRASSDSRFSALACTSFGWRVLTGGTHNSKAGRGGTQKLRDRPGFVPHGWPSLSETSKSPAS